jgi:hypothetical protein
VSAFNPPQPVSYKDAIVAREVLTADIKKTLADRADPSDSIFNEITKQLVAAQAHRSIDHIETPDNRTETAH